MFHDGELSAALADGHRPIYTTSVGPTVVSVAQDLRNALEPLITKYQVLLASLHATILDICSARK